MAYTIQPNTGTTELQGFDGGGGFDGGTAGDASAQRFTTTGAGTAGSCTFSITYRSVEGTPTNPWTFNIYADSGGTTPTGTSLGAITATILPADLTDNSGASTVVRTFNDAVSLSASTNYWMVGSKSNSDAKTYYISGDNATGSQFRYLRSGVINTVSTSWGMNFILTVNTAAAASGVVHNQTLLGVGT